MRAEFWFRPRQPSYLCLVKRVADRGDCVRCQIFSLWALVARPSCQCVTTVRATGEFEFAAAPSSSRSVFPFSPIRLSPRVPSWVGLFRLDFIYESVDWGVSNCIWFFRPRMGCAPSWCHPCYQQMTAFHFSKTQIESMTLWSTWFATFIFSVNGIVGFNRNRQI